MYLPLLHQEVAYLLCFQTVDRVGLGQTSMLGRPRQLSGDLGLS